MRTTTKAYMLTILFCLAVIGAIYMALHPAPTPTLTATHRPDGSIESVGSTTTPAPSDGLLVSKGDAVKWVDSTMIPPNSKCRVGWNCGIKYGEFVPVSRWTLAQEMEFSESRSSVTIIDGVHQ